jgi:hypothetical protein
MSSLLAQKSRFHTGWVKSRLQRSNFRGPLLPQERTFSEPFFVLNSGPVGRDRSFKWVFSLRKLEDFAREPGPPVRKKVASEI